MKLQKKTIAVLTAGGIIVIIASVIIAFEWSIYSRPSPLEIWDIANNTPEVKAYIQKYRHFLSYLDKSGPGPQEVVYVVSGCDLVNVTCSGIVEYDKSIELRVIMDQQNRHVSHIVLTCYPDKLFIASYAQVKDNDIAGYLDAGGCSRL